MFCLEQEALASYNYLEQLIDADEGFTYFNVFLSEPAEAVHDWPDFLDVPGRSAETSVLLRCMTGRPVATEAAFFRRILRFQGTDGLFYRPETKLTRYEAQPVEQAFAMQALLARVVADCDADATNRLELLLDGLTRLKPEPNALSGMLIRPLVGVYEKTGADQALELAQRLRDFVLGGHRLFRADGTFPGHVHSHLCIASGLVDFGRLTNDEGLIRQMDEVFRAMRARSTSFGFVPELTERKDDVIGCETCCLMDYLHLAIALTKTGRTEYFDDIERAVRNHLVESRVKEGDWLAESNEAQDEELTCRRGLRDKIKGAYAGWSSPNHVLAYDEFLPATWVKTPDLAPIYLNKIRALQNCCGPSGPKALYLAWQHASRVDGTILRVNLLMDRSPPEAEIRGHEPYKGRVEVRMHSPLRVALRVPSSASHDTVRCQLNGRCVGLCREQNYAVTPELETGDVAVFVYPLTEREERVGIGNEGFQQYEYAVSWRGSTVMRMVPGDNAGTGRSHLMAAPVRLYYGQEGPHLLYQRERLLDVKPEQARLHTTEGPGIW